MKSIKIEKKEKKIETKNGSNVDCQENVNGEDNRAKRWGIKRKVTDDEVRTEEVRERIRDRDRGRVSKSERERERERERVSEYEWNEMKRKKWKLVKTVRDSS